MSAGNAADDRPQTVLVVEDDRGVRDLLVTVLSAEGFEVRTARDGLEGLLKLRMTTPVAVVLDIMMPDVGGLRVLDELACEHAQVPVIVVTGKPEAAETASVRLGAENVFPKPFDIDELVARVRDLATAPAPAAGGDAPAGGGEGRGEAGGDAPAGGGEGRGEAGADAPAGGGEGK